MRTHLHHLLAERADTHPDDPAVTYRDDTLTYGEAWRQAQRVAAQLRGLGLERGDRVAVYLEKRLETIASIFGISAAGGVFVPINHVLKPPQVAHIVNDSGARVLITSSDRWHPLTTTLAPSDLTHVIVTERETPADVGDLSLHAWGDPARAEPASIETTVDIDPAAILYTSGSTGKPKGVVLSHRNLIVGAESVSSYLGNTRDDVILSILPLSFDAGLSQVTTAFSVGAHCILMNYLLPRDVVRLCEKHGVTGMTCVPPLWMQLTAAPWPPEVASRVRYWANTGGRMPRTTLDRLRATFARADPFLMYGLTEAFRSTYLEPAEVDRRPGSIGKAIPDAEVLVLRPDGTRCDPGEAGELVHRGPLVALGYWNDSARTAERFRPVVHPGQAWRAPERAVWSGDTVFADEDGFLFFVGRTDDMIKTSGYRVSPTEVEEAAYATGLVQDAVAIGVDDVALGQRIVLVVTPAAEALEGAALLAALRPAVPAYMIPSRVEVRADLPRSPNGKFDRPLIATEVSA